MPLKKTLQLAAPAVPQCNTAVAGMNTSTWNVAIRSGATQSAKKLENCVVEDNASTEIRGVAWKLNNRLEVTLLDLKPSKLKKDAATKSASIISWAFSHFIVSEDPRESFFFLHKKNMLPYTYRGTKNRRNKTGDCMFLFFCRTFFGFNNLDKLITLLLKCMLLHCQ